MEYAFVSGATGGIGKEFCYSLAKRKENLFITARSEDKLCALKEELVKKFGVNVITFSCDLTSLEERQNLVQFVKDNGIKLARIVNVAGVDTQKPVLDYTEEKLLFQLKVNAEATIHLTHSLLFYRAQSCKIITIGSMSGATPMPYFALYSATKSMLESFFISLHYELKKQGVFVTVVAPGGVPTRPDIIEEIKKQGLWGKLSAKTPEYIAEKSIKKSDKNKIKYVPGFFNKFLNCTIKIAPKRVVLKFIARRWKKTSKDAF